MPMAEERAPCGPSSCANRRRGAFGSSSTGRPSSTRSRPSCATRSARRSRTPTAIRASGSSRSPAPGGRSAPATTSPRSSARIAWRSVARPARARHRRRRSAIWRCSKPVIAQVHGYCPGRRPRAGDGLRPDRGRRRCEARRARDPLRLGAGHAADAVPDRSEGDPRAALHRRPHRRGRGRADRPGQPGRPGRPAGGRGRRAGRPDRPGRARRDGRRRRSMLNRAMEAAGFLAAVEAGLDLGVDHQHQRDDPGVRRDHPTRRAQGGPRLARPHATSPSARAALRTRFHHGPATGRSRSGARAYTRRHA